MNIADRDSHATGVSTSADFVCIAHRGMRSHFPENTLSAFKGALDHGCLHFETDAQLTSDGACVLFHDDNLDRTTNGSGKLEETSAAELSKLDAGAWFNDAFAGERVPSLESVLREFGGRAHIHLELKSSQVDLPDKVAEAVLGHMQPAWQQGGPWAAPGLTITSFHLPQLQRSLELLPGIRHSWLIQEVSQQVLGTAHAAGIAQICPRTNALTKSDAAKVQAAGLSLRAWGVRSTQMLEGLVGMGVRGATVDWPLDARAALEACKQAPASAEHSPAAAL